MMIFIIRRGPKKIEGIPFDNRKPHLRKVKGWYLSHIDSDGKHYGGGLLSRVVVSRLGAYNGGNV
jgi:hypothetical protein